MKKPNNDLNLFYSHRVSNRYEAEAALRRIHTRRENVMLLPVQRVLLFSGNCSKPVERPSRCRLIKEEIMLCGSLLSHTRSRSLSAT